MNKGMIARDSHKNKAIYHNDGPKMQRDIETAMNRIVKAETDYRYDAATTVMRFPTVRIDVDGRLKASEINKLTAHPVFFNFPINIKLPDYSEFLPYGSPEPMNSLGAETLELWVEAIIEVDLIRDKAEIEPIVRYHYYKEGGYRAESIVSFDDTLRQRDRRKLEGLNALMDHRAHEIFVNGPLLMKAAELKSHVDGVRGHSIIKALGGF